MVQLSEINYKSEFEKFEEGNYQIKQYKSNALARTLDNYSANMSQAVFREITDTVDFVTLKINRIVRGDTDLNVGSSEEVYIAGSNHAIFVDIPEGNVDIVISACLKVSNHCTVNMVVTDIEV